MIEKISETYNFTSKFFEAEFEFNKKTKDIYVVIYKMERDITFGDEKTKLCSFLIERDEEVSELYDVFKALYDINMGGKNE